MTCATDSIKPICLPMGADQTRNLDGQNLIVSGWGATERGNSSEIKWALFLFMPIFVVQSGMA
jgi:hypothetical protein